MRHALLAPLLAALAAPAHAAALNVVTTTEGLASLVREVGGDRVEVASLSRGIQDPHFVDANPNLAVKLRRADLLVDVGLDLEIGWLPGLVNISRNPDIQPAGRRRLVAASAVPVFEMPVGPVDRSQGDIHPAGNPHFLSDPRRAAKVAEAIAARLGDLDPDGAAGYRARLADFERRLQAASGGWLGQLAPFRGARVVTRHKTLSYFFDWCGIVPAAYLEPKPGIPPPPSHLADVVELVRRDKIREILVENYYDTRSADLVAKLAGARVVVIPGDVGGTPEAKDYVSYMGELVRLVAQGLR